MSMQIGPLTALAQKYGCEKWDVHRYTPHYERHFAAYRDLPIKLFEIGVGGYSDANAGGASLKMWRDYFTIAQITALDCFDKSPHAGDRIRIYQGEQQNEDTLLKIDAESGPFDIIIDDGSHDNAHVLKSFSVLFPLLNDGGVYVVEDTQSAYWPGCGGSMTEFNTLHTSMGFFKSLVDGLNFREIPRDAYEPNYADKHIVGISFYHNIVFIHKGDNSRESNFLNNNKFLPHAEYLLRERG